MEIEPKEETSKQKGIKNDLLTFAYELGIWIVAPLVVFLLAGLWIDKHFGTKPLGMITALLVSLLSTGISISKKVKQFNP